jgi:S1-C subfamily serine protease
LNEPGHARKPGKIGVTIDREAPNALVKSVKENSPAAEVGVREDDVVVQFDNVKIRDGGHLIDVIRRKRRGKVYSMSILRNGKLISFEIQPR